MALPDLCSIIFVFVIFFDDSRQKGVPTTVQGRAGVVFAAYS
jgi:hypothetical protein